MKKSCCKSWIIEKSGRYLSLLIAEPTTALIQPVIIDNRKPLFFNYGAFLYLLSCIFIISQNRLTNTPSRLRYLIVLIFPWCIDNIVGLFSMPLSLSRLVTTATISWVPGVHAKNLFPYWHFVCRPTCYCLVAALLTRLFVVRLAAWRA
jgi:hypothetical protein